MNLIVYELEGSDLTQALTTPARKVSVTAVRPHIVRWLWPVGSLKVQILTEADVLVAESNSVNISAVGGEDYFHGYVRFDVYALLERETVYKFKLVGGGGYSFSESAYIGWANGYDLGKYDATYSPASALVKPLDIEVWERKSK